MLPWRRKVALLTPRLAVLLLAVAVLLLLLLLLVGRHKADRGTRGGSVGAPPSVLLWTMMRSGSRMAQHLLTGQPCSFPTEEPLRSRFRKQGLNASVNLLQDLVACRFSAHPDYLREWVSGMYVNDPRVARLCRAYHSLCWEATLIETLCRTSCIRLLRVVAADLAMAMGLMHERGSNTHIVHLVRDPRGMFSSKRNLQEGKEYVMVYENKTVNFLPNDEMNLSAVCQRYRHDLTVATHLARHYPDRYTLVRYEDIARRPHREVHRLYAFIGLPYTPVAATVVNKHTMGFFAKGLEKHPFSTNKNSSGTVFEWRSRLPFSEVDRIQEECGDVLRAYGYRHFSRHQYEEQKDSPCYLFRWAGPHDRHTGELGVKGSLFPLINLLRSPQLNIKTIAQESATLGM